MDEVTRGELEKLHGRINDMRERIVTLEAQQPHINAALLRIEGSVGKLADRIRNALWALLLLVLSPLAVLLIKAFASARCLLISNSNESGDRLALPKTAPGSPPQPSLPDAAAIFNRGGKHDIRLHPHLPALCRGNPCHQGGDCA
jgi:hypothetical protein